MTTRAKLQSRIPGGDYTALQNEDGTWDLIDVPILAQMKKGEKGAHDDLGKEWLELVKTNLLELAVQDRHFKRVHIGHHSLFQKAVPAGYLVPTKVEQISLKGKKIWALFATLKSIPAQIFALIENAELPYRSVEVRSWEKGELSSLALMDTEDPFWEFPLTTVGKKLERPAKDANPETVLACALGADGGGAILLSFHDGGKMAFDKKDDKAGEEDVKKDASGLDNKIDKTDEKGADKTEGEGKDEKKTEGKVDEGSVQAMLQQLLQSNTQMMELMKRLVAGVAPATETNPIKPTEQEDLGDKKSASATMSVKEAAQLAAKSDEAVATINNFNRERKIESIVKKAKDDLKGWHVSEATLARLSKLAEANLDGSVVAEFVAEYKTSVPKEPPKDGASAARGVTESPEVLKFAAGGPDALDAARRFGAIYAQLKAQNAVEMPIERFIEINIAAEAGVAHLSNGRKN